MKKINRFVLCFAFILLLSIIFAGCVDRTNPEAVYGFEQGRHDYNVDYGYSFDTYVLKKGNIEFHVQDTVYYANKIHSKTLFKTVESDYNTLNGIFELETTIKIYVVKNVLSGSGFYSNEKIYCNANVINNLFYRTNLTAAYVKISEPWRQYGAYKFAFSDTSENNRDSLTSYYNDNDEDNLLTLSLFAAYFNDGFADTATKTAAQKTAQDYGKYLIDTHGVNYFLNAGLSGNYRQEWLNSIGVTKTFNMPYDLSWLNGATYTSPYLYAYSLVITTPTRIYNLEPIPEKYGNLITDAFNTPWLVLKELSELNTEMLNILSYIELQAPLNYPRILSKYNEKITYYISPTERSSSADVNYNRVYLYELGDFIHETMHILTCDNNSFDGLWLTEGIAEYFSYFISQKTTGKANRIFWAYTLDWTGYDNRLLSFLTASKEYYLSKGGTISTFEEFDCALMYEAFSTATLTNPNYKLIDFPIVTTTIAQMRPGVGLTGDGVDLTYPEAYLFTKYLIESYNLDTVLSLCLSTTYDFGQYFDKTYNEVFSRFLSELYNV